MKTFVSTITYMFFGFLTAAAVLTTMALLLAMSWWIFRGVFWLTGAFGAQ